VAARRHRNDSALITGQIVRHEGLGADAAVSSYFNEVLTRVLFQSLDEVLHRWKGLIVAVCGSQSERYCEGADPRDEL
jgi:hypothetical protein